MIDIELGVHNEMTTGILCDRCKEVHHYADELVFLLNEQVVSVSERYPDWDSALCTVCAEELKVI